MWILVLFWASDLCQIHCPAEQWWQAAAPVPSLGQLGGTNAIHRALCAKLLFSRPGVVHIFLTYNTVNMYFVQRPTNSLASGSMCVLSVVIVLTIILESLCVIQALLISSLVRSQSLSSFLFTIKVFHRVGEINSVNKVLPLEAWGTLVSFCNWGKTAYHSAPCLESQLRGGRARQIPQAHWPASLACLVSSRWSVAEAHYLRSFSDLHTLTAT